MSETDRISIRSATVDPHVDVESNSKLMKADLQRGPWQDVWMVKGFDFGQPPDSRMIEINGVPGWIIPGDFVHLWNLAAELPEDGMYLEVGSWMGLTAITVANSLVANMKFGAKVYCVDTWEGSPAHRFDDAIVTETLYDAFLRNVDESRMSHFIRPLRGDSREISSQVEDQSFDVVFIDGDHSFGPCYSDIKAWFPKLKQGGRMLGHDCAPDSEVERAVAKYAREMGIEYTVSAPPESHYIWELNLSAHPAIPVAPLIPKADHRMSTDGNP